MLTATPHPVPLPIRWGEGGRRPGEGFPAQHDALGQIAECERRHTVEERFVFHFKNGQVGIMGNMSNVGGVKRRIALLFD